jgi:hypothetical protein
MFFSFSKLPHSIPALPRSNPRGVTCHPHTRRRRRRDFDLLGYRTVTRESGPLNHFNGTAGRGRIATPPDRDQGADRRRSPRIQERISTRKMARPRHTPARTETKPTAKEKTPRTPPASRVPTPDLHPLPDRSPWQPRNLSGSYSAHRPGLIECPCPAAGRTARSQ